MSMAVATAKDRFSIYGYFVVHNPDVDFSVKISLMPGPSSMSRRKLVLFCDNHAEKTMWVKALKEHAEYVAPS